MVDPVVWLCVHGEESVSCELCEDEDIQVNGIWVAQEEQCQHEFVDMDGVCWDCGIYVEGR